MPRYLSLKNQKDRTLLDVSTFSCQKPQMNYFFFFWDKSTNELLGFKQAIQISKLVFASKKRLLSS